MIGVISRKDEIAAVEEFFQLFKTPWEFYRPGSVYDVLLVTGNEVPDAEVRLVLVYGSQTRERDQAGKLSPKAGKPNAIIRHQELQVPLYRDLLTFAVEDARVLFRTTSSEIAGVKIEARGRREVRIGYDLFLEINTLLRGAQPLKQAHIPTLELHIEMLRNLILDAGISITEIASTPAGYSFAVCLTHDIDFVGIRRHKFDHTMLGFLYRSTVGAARDAFRRKISLGRLAASLKAAASLPFVYLGLAKDFWMTFDWYMEVEKGLSPTYFFIPFKKRCGDKVSAPHSERRASAYDIGDIPELIQQLRSEGSEIGVHGIDAWHSVQKGRDELNRVAALTGKTEMGIRMHWLLQDEYTCSVLEQAGYSYDSTAGYNEMPGYRCGTSQVFRPFNARTLLELPLHIQDGALFYPTRLGLSEAKASELCERFIANAQRFGGVLTVLWHDRSPGPERFWGDFYAGLVRQLKSLNVWFGTAGEVVAWFRNRRQVRFERTVGDSRVKVYGPSLTSGPGFTVRTHTPRFGVGGTGQAGKAVVSDVVWDGQAPLQLETPGGVDVQSRSAEFIPHVSPTEPREIDPALQSANRLSGPDLLSFSS